MAAKVASDEPERRESDMHNLILGLALQAAILAVIPAGPAAVADEIIDATDPARILAVVLPFGEATLTTDDLGDPPIEGRIGEKEHRLFFHGRSVGRDCSTLTFAAEWEAEDVTDEMMADRNREKRFGKAYLDEDGHAAVEISVNLPGGVTSVNLAVTIDWWRLVMEEFAEHHDS